MLHDYKNGQWELLHKWDTEETSDAAIEIVGNMMDRAEDEIFISSISCGPGNGMFMVVDSERRQWVRAFWTGIYEPDEAFKDVAVKCREIADQMGYRRPDTEETA